MSEPSLFHLTRGESRLVISVPHAGTYLPDAIARLLTPVGRAVVDTDWHVDRLVDFAPALGATLLVATHSRTVVDLNRAPGGGLLYPGKIETGLCPTESFAGDPLYEGEPPTQEAVEARTIRYWQPYHDALRAELARVKTLHGVAHLLDLHSIASRVPRLFEGRLPDLNIGTNDGASADPALVARILEAARASTPLTMVLDGRFKGGAITRVYGDPAAGVHAIQIETAQAAYMNEADPHAYDEAFAGRVKGFLRACAVALV
jgi:N-formylglutamate deformylase